MLLSATQKKSAYPWRHEPGFAKKPSMRGLKAAKKYIDEPYSLKLWQEGLQRLPDWTSCAVAARALDLLDNLDEERIREASIETLRFAECYYGSYGRTLMTLFAACRTPSDLVELLLGLDQPLRDAFSKHASIYVNHTETMWGPVRHHLCRASAAEYAAAVALASEAWETADEQTRFMIGFLFPNEPWATDILRTLGWVPAVLVCSTRDVDLLMRCLPATGGSDRTRILATLGVGLDAEVVIGLCEHLLQVDPKRANVASLVPVVKMLAAYDRTTAARLLADLAGNKDLGDVVSSYFASHPHHVDLLTTPAGRALAATFAVVEVDGEVATTEQLPPLLRGRTWRETRSKPPAPLEMPEVSFASRMADTVVPARQHGVPVIDMTSTELSKWRAERMAPVDVWWIYGKRTASWGTFSAIQSVTIPPAEEALKRWNEGSCRVSSPVHWVAQHGLAALPGVLLREEEIVSSFDYAHNLWAAALNLMHTPEIAWFFARMSAKRKHTRMALSWLAERLDLAVHGLLPLALGPFGKPRERCERVLTRLSRMGHRERMVALAAPFGDAAVAAFVALLDRVPTLPGKAPKLPSFVQPDTLPRLRLKTGELLATDDQAAMLELLSRAPTAAAFPGMDILFAALDIDSVDAFLLQLLERWVRHKAPARHDWVMQAVVALPSPVAVQKVGELVRAWAVSKKTHAARGVVVLSMLADDLSLMHLSHISATTRFTALKQTAMELLEEAAAERGLTLDELGDRTVPTLGLTEGGTTVDYGERTFTLKVDTSMALAVFDGDGVRIKTLPPKRGTDDAAKVASAKTTFKSLRKALDSTRRRQTLRLEQAMVSGRSWSLQDARSFLFEHPLLRAVARGLVWMADTPFRIDESGEFVDADDEPIEVEGAVRIAHPLEIDRDAWRALFDDYELLQPLNQLGRSVHSPSAEESAATDLGSVVQGVVVPARKQVGWLEARGWRRIHTDTISGYQRVARTAEGAARLVIELASSVAIMDLDHATAEIDSVRLERSGAAIPFGELHAIDFSELKALLTEYATRGW